VPSTEIGTANFQQYAFLLEGAATEVPEPGAIGLVTAGIVIFFLFRALKR
jgi:hypothetical protein